MHSLKCIFRDTSTTGLQLHSLIPLTSVLIADSIVIEGCMRTSQMQSRHVYDIQPRAVQTCVGVHRPNLNSDPYFAKLEGFPNQELDECKSRGHPRRSVTSSKPQLF